MPTTTTANLIIPEVMSDLIDSKLGDRVSLMPLAVQDNTLQGQPGDTLKFPAFRYIGKADEVAENAEISPSLLTSYTVSAQVKKYAKAVQLTDEARLSGVGDPVGEAATQLAHAIDHAVDDALFQQLDGLALGRLSPAAALSADAVADALALFGEDLDGPKAILVDPLGFAALRKDPDYIRASDLGQRAIFSGVVGEIWGCQIVVSNKIKHNSTRQDTRYPILKPGALRLVNKQGTMVEVEREPKFMRDNIFASKHCAAYLYDDSKAAAIIIITGVQAVPAADYGISCVAGDVGKTRLIIPAEQTPLGCYWKYVLNSTPGMSFPYGAPYAGGTEYSSPTAQITAGANTHIHAVLLDSDDCPVKSVSLEIVKGA